VDSGCHHLLAVCTADTEWSLPLDVSVTADRKTCLFLPKRDAPVDNGSSNLALVVTLHNRAGQVFIVLEDDDRPQMAIHNNLGVSIRYGQKPAEPRGVFRSASHQTLGPGRTCYYALPGLLENFPFKDSLIYAPFKLAIAKANTGTVPF